MTPAEDPGWPSALVVLLMLIPGARLLYMRRQRSGDPLVLLRSVFLSFSIALVLFGVVTEFVALFAFVFTFIGGPAWIYDVGGAFAQVRFWMVIAPTRSALMRDQDTLNAQSCGLSLIAALRGSPPPTGN